MANVSNAETVQLAVVLAEYDPTFLAGLSHSLEVWISKNAKGPASLTWMQPFCNKGNAPALGQLLGLLPRERLEAFAAKLDKHNPELAGFSPEDTIRHIALLASGELEPALKAQGSKKGKPKAPSNKPTGKMKLAEILKLSDAEQRARELNLLSDRELKSQLIEVGMDVPGHLTKPKRVSFIQEELAAGWPKPRSILDSSRY